MQLILQFLNSFIGFLIHSHAWNGIQTHDPRFERSKTVSTFTVIG